MTKKIMAKTLKGFRDFLPEEARIREMVIEKIKQNFRLFGFQPLETPALEYAEVLLGKYGSEAEKLIYLFQDRGGRKIGLRYDQTVPLARVIANYPNLTKPLKRYQIQPVWRADNPQKGRFREFTQTDIDIIGEKSPLADAEIIACAIRTVQQLGLKKIKMVINDRLIFKRLSQKVITVFDKWEKIGKKRVIEELQYLGKSLKEAETLVSKIENEKPTSNLLKIFAYLKSYGFQENTDFQFQPRLARGLDYYTSTIFELVDEEADYGSLGGGGRYDKLIFQFSGQDLPAVGFSFGLDRLIEVLKQENLLKNSLVNYVFVAYFKETFSQALKLTQKLRENQINCEINLDPEKKLDKQLKYADKKGLTYVLILGEDEVKKKVVKLKNLKTKQQKEINLDFIVKELKTILSY